MELFKQATFDFFLRCKEAPGRADDFLPFRNCSGYSVCFNLSKGSTDSRLTGEFGVTNSSFIQRAVAKEDL